MEPSTQKVPIGLQAHGLAPTLCATKFASGNPSRLLAMEARLKKSKQVLEPVEFEETHKFGDSELVVYLCFLLCLLLRFVDAALQTKQPQAYWVLVSKQLTIDVFLPSRDLIPKAFGYQGTLCVVDSDIRVKKPVFPESCQVHLMRHLLY